MFSTFFWDLYGIKQCLFLAICEVIWDWNREILVVDVVELHNSLEFSEKGSNSLLGDDLGFFSMSLNLEEPLILLASKRSRIELSLFLQVDFWFNGHISLGRDEGVVQIRLQFHASGLSDESFFSAIAHDGGSLSEVRLIGQYIHCSLLNSWNFGESRPEIHSHDWAFEFFEYAFLWFGHVF